MLEGLVADFDRSLVVLVFEVAGAHVGIDHCQVGLDLVLLVVCCWVSRAAVVASCRGRGHTGEHAHAGHLVVQSTQSENSLNSDSLDFFGFCFEVFVRN